MLIHERSKKDVPRCTRLSRKPSVWKEAKRSIVTGVLLAAFFVAVLAGYARLMPALPVYDLPTIVHSLCCPLKPFL